MLDRVTFALAFAAISALAAIYVFQMVALVPYWRGLQSEPLQAWFASHWPRVYLLIVPLHLGSVLVFCCAFVLRKGRGRHLIWWIALLGLAVAVGVTFSLFAFVLTPRLQSGSLTETSVAATLDLWLIGHAIRTAAILISAAAMGTLAVILR